MKNPVWLIVIGFVMEVAAIVLILLILIQLLPSTYFLNFFAFTISVAGLFMGVIGSTSIVKIRRDARKKDEEMNGSG